MHGLTKPVNIEADGSAPLPPVVRIEPASACNLKCVHCPTGVFDMERRVMPMDLFERVLSEVARHVPPIRVAVLYHGGEPFLNKNFLKMVAAVKGLGIPLVKTVSNGMLIKPEMAEAIVTSGLDAIEISMDGTSPEENDAIRRRSSFATIREVVRALVNANRKHGKPLTVSISTTQFWKVADYQAGVEAVAPAYVKEALADVFEDLNIKTTWAMLWPSGEPQEGFDILWDDRNQNEATGCDLLEDTISIRADGKVVPCCYDLTSHTVVGNIRDTSLEDIWNGEAFRRFRRDFAAKNYPPLCQECNVVTGGRYLIQKSDPESPRRVIRLSEGALTT